MNKLIRENKRSVKTIYKMNHWRHTDGDKTETENKSTCRCCHGNHDVKHVVWDFDNRAGEGEKSDTNCFKGWSKYYWSGALHWI